MPCQMHHILNCVQMYDDLQWPRIDLITFATPESNVQILNLVKEMKNNEAQASYRMNERKRKNL